jgi:hypothetical protein
MMATKLRIDGAVADRLRTHAIEHPHWSPAEVHRTLVSEANGRPVVSLRTVQRFLRDFNRPDESGRWALDDVTDPEDIPLVLGVMRPFVEDSAYPPPGSPRWPTRAMADWIVRIRRAYPDLDDAGLVYYLAGLAVRGQTALVETYLTFTPWRDPEPLFRAVMRGAVQADALIWGLAMDYPAWAIKAQHEQARAQEAWDKHRRKRADKSASKRAPVEQERRRLEEGTR